MALPSREHLITEVDREFARRYPQAPRHLDPDDPAQAQFVEAWDEMYTGLLDQTVDSHFFRFFPDAPQRLDPNDPAHGGWVAYWLDIRDGIVHRTSRYSWDAPPEADDTATAAARPDDTSRHPSGEPPELHPYTSSEWVTYLQRLMTYHGWWAGAETGNFDDELLAAVRAVQVRYWIARADGVVRVDTWALLTGDASGLAGGVAGASTQAAPAQSQPLRGTGARAEEVPASFQLGGLPAFRYNLPSVPAAEADFDTGDAAVQLKLSLTGYVVVTFPDPAPSITGVINDGTWRLAASESLNGLVDRIQIQGIGGEQIAFGSTFGTSFEQTEVRFTPPNTMSYVGRCSVDYHYPTALGTARVQGSAGYQLDVTVIPHPQLQQQEQEQEVTDERGWLSRWGAALVGVGVATLVVVVAIAAAPETGGGSLLAITEAEALGEAAAGAL